MHSMSVPAMPRFDTARDMYFAVYNPLRQLAGNDIRIWTSTKGSFEESANPSIAAPCFRV